MFRIRRFGVIRTANIVAFLYVIVIVVVFVPVALIVGIAGSNVNLGGNVGGFNGVTGNAMGFGLLLLGLVLAVFYGIAGWIFTAIACLLYNLAARVVGGIEIQLEAVEPPPPAAVWGTGQTTPPPAPPSMSPPGSPPAP